MKTLITISILLIVFTGCAARTLYVDPALVGTWHWTNSVGWTYVFNEDGTGQRGETVIHHFTWGTDAGVLVLDHGAGYVNDEFIFSLSGNILQLGGEFGMFTYFKNVPDANLVGSWLNTDYLIEKRIDPDGTGVYESFQRALVERRYFNWYSVADMFIHQINGQQDEWTYTVSVNWLMLENRRVAGHTQQWQRGSFTENTALIGEWYWNENEAYRLIFFEGSTARQNLDGTVVPLYWTTFGDVLFLINIQTSMAEQWRFNITAGELHIESLAREEARRYHRVIND